MATRTDIHALVRSIIDAVAPDLLKTDMPHVVEYLRDLVEHNEQGIALEDACANLAEFGIAVSQPVYDNILKAAAIMQMDPAQILLPRIQQT